MDGEPIRTAERLVSGDSFRLLHFQFRFSMPGIFYIATEMCEAITTTSSSSAIFVCKWHEKPRRWNRITIYDWLVWRTWLQGTILLKSGIHISQAVTLCSTLDRAKKCWTNFFQHWAAKRYCIKHAKLELWINFVRKFGQGFRKRSSLVCKELPQSWHLRERERFQ